MGLIFIPQVDQAGGPAVRQGIETWSATENYVVDDEVVIDDGGTLKIYTALTANINKSPLVNPADWKEVSPAGVTSNLYLADGALTSARTVTLDGNNLVFSGTSNITFSAGGDISAANSLLTIRRIDASSGAANGYRFAGFTDHAFRHLSVGNMYMEVDGQETIRFHRSGSRRAITNIQGVPIANLDFESGTDLNTDRIMRLRNLSGENVVQVFADGDIRLGEGAGMRVGINADPFSGSDIAMLRVAQAGSSAVSAIWATSTTGANCITADAGAGSAIRARHTGGAGQFNEVMQLSRRTGNITNEWGTIELQSTTPADQTNDQQVVLLSWKATAGDTAGNQTGQFRIGIADNGSLNSPRLLINPTTYQLHGLGGTGDRLLQADLNGVVTASVDMTTLFIAPQFNALIGAPTATEDGYVVSWDNTAGEYTLTPDATATDTGIYVGSGTVPAGVTATLTDYINFSGGSVGIGTTTPSELLDVNTPLNTTGGIVVSEDNVTKAALKFLNGEGGVLELLPDGASSIRTKLSGEVGGRQYFNSGNNNGFFTVNSNGATQTDAPILLVPGNPVVTHSATAMVASASGPVILRVHGTGSDGNVEISSWQNVANPQNHRIYSFTADAGSSPTNGSFLFRGWNDDDAAGRALKKTTVRQTYWGAYDDRFEINVGSNDYDFIVKGDTDTNLIYADAGLDRVGIGRVPVNSKLEVAGDVETVGGTNGLILEDRSTGTRYRVYIDNNVITTEVA